MRPRLQPRAWTPAELEAELARVHAREFGRLLGRAALLRAGHGRDLAAWLDALEVERDDARWRGDASVAIQLAGSDGFEAPGMLRHCLGREVARWRSGVHLAEAARALGGDEGVRWHHVLAHWLDGGRPASGALAGLARTCVTPCWRVRARRAQALALEYEGEERAALGVWTELGLETPAAVRPWLEAALLAARLGDRARWHELVLRLASLAAPSVEPDAACASACARFRCSGSPAAFALVAAELPPDAARAHPWWRPRSTDGAAEEE